MADQLDEVCGKMREAQQDLAQLQDLAMEFWSSIIDASRNIAYRLAYNSLRETYDRCRELLTQTLADELRDTDSYAAIASGIRRGNPAITEECARELVRRGAANIKRALDELDPAHGTAGRCNDRSTSLSQHRTKGELRSLLISSG